MPRLSQQLTLPTAFALAAALIGCAAFNEKPTTWQNLHLPGSVLILESESEVEELRFLGESVGGWVVATLGSKNGALTGPVLPWRIEGKDLVVGYGTELQRLELVRVELDRLVARRTSGQIVQFRLVKA